MRDKCHLIVNYFVKAVADDNVEDPGSAREAEDVVDRIGMGRCGCNGRGVSAVAPSERGYATARRCPRS